MSTQSLSRAQARRIGLAAQGLHRPRPKGRVDRRHLRQVFETVGHIQIDSVNVLVRSHELPLFARLGPHRRDLLPRMLDDGELFEYWGHEASFIPQRDFPLYRWKMDRAYNGDAWSGLVELQKTRPDYVEWVLDEVRSRGPISAGEIEEDARRAGPWWGWKDAKLALEYLFWTGQVSARRRWNTFERVYDLPERLVGVEHHDQERLTEDEARRRLLLKAARALGVAAAVDLAEYHRQRPTHVRPILDDLVATGELEPVTVEGWKQPAYLHPDAALPRRVSARALLSPFDSLLWERPRVERLFDFHYRIEIYTPAPKRRFGYYVLPFLLGDRLVARVDLKADRKAGLLLAPGAYAEEGEIPEEIAGPLAEELTLMAGWLGLDDVAVGTRGDLADPLRAALT